MAELSLPPGVVLDCVILEAICFAVSSEVDIPSTCQIRHAWSVIVGARIVVCKIDAMIEHGMH